ncbi:hypothetical protein D3C84_1132400 [compost metagenome]
MTLCGTDGGAEMMGKAFLDEGYVVYNHAKQGQLVETQPSEAGAIAFFSGESQRAADVEARQWIDAILNDTDPMVKPEQAYVVTQILEAIYKSAETGKPVEL